MGGKIDCVTLAFMEEMIAQLSGFSASPGYTWGDSGNISSGSYLLNETVPSNRAGRIVTLSNGEIAQVYVANQNNSTATIEIVKRVGGTFSAVTSISLSSERTKAEDKSGVLVTKGDELACRIASGSVRNVVVGAIIRGTNI